MSRNLSTKNLPPWEVLNLVAHYLDPKTLAIASCVSKSWFNSMSSDFIWQPICKTHYLHLSNLKITDPLVSYSHLYSIGYTAYKHRIKPPLKPRISLENLTFVIDLRATKNDHPLVTIVKQVNELANVDGVFRFDVDVNGNVSDECLVEIEMLEDVKMSWIVVLRGWKGVFTMMECEGKLSGAGGGWFSEELPSPGCCSSEVASGIVADLKLGFGGGVGGDGKVWVDKVSVGMLSIVNWRYVSVDDGLRYLQHFLVPIKC